MRSSDILGMYRPDAVFAEGSLSINNFAKHAYMPQCSTFANNFHGHISFACVLADDISNIVHPGAVWLWCIRHICLAIFFILRDTENEEATHNEMSDMPDYH